MREFEHITFARMHLASGAMPDAMRLLERLLRAADGGARTGSVIEILVVQKLAHEMRGDIAAALVSLERRASALLLDGMTAARVDIVISLLEVSFARDVEAKSWFSTCSLAVFWRAEKNWLDLLPGAIARV